MKLRNNLLTAALLAVAAPAAFAQSTGDVSISGSIVPGSCTVTLANGGVVDLGQINTSALSLGTPTFRPPQTVAANVVCTAPTVIAMTAFDNRIATLPVFHANSTTRFGLGLSNGATGNPLGTFLIQLNTPVADGAASSFIQSTDLVSWVAAAGDWQKSNVATNTRYRAYGTAGSGPVAITTGDFNLQVTAAIEPTSLMNLTADALIDGSATLEITYI